MESFPLILMDYWSHMSKRIPGGRSILILRADYANLKHPTPSSSEKEIIIAHIIFNNVTE
jgi:hypothetical protein